MREVKPLGHVAARVMQAVIALTVPMSDGAPSKMSARYSALVSHGVPIQAKAAMQTAVITVSM